MFKIFIRDSRGLIFNLNVEKTYKIIKIKKMIKEIKHLDYDIDLEYNFVRLDDYDTLEKSNIGPGCKLDYCGRYFGNGYGINMADISNKRGLVKKKFGNKAEKWNLLTRGLNVTGKCKNNNCEAYNKEVDCQIGMGTFDLVRDADCIKMPNVLK